MGEIFGTNLFEVFYHNESKPKGKRSLGLYNFNTYEEVFERVVIELCEKAFGHDFLFGIQDELEEEVLSENKYSVVYKVTFNEGNKVHKTYIVEIELIKNGGQYNPSYKCDENSDMYTPEHEKSLKEKYKEERELKYQKWYLDIDDLFLSLFIKDFENSTDLDDFKKHEISNRLDLESLEEAEEEFNQMINKCIEMGIVKDGKLVKSIYRENWKRHSEFNDFDFNF